MSNDVLEMTADQAEWFAEVAGATAYRVRRRWYQWVEFEDLESEAWAWLFTDPERTRKLLAKDDAEQQVSKHLHGHLEAHARAEKATRSGYKPEDEFFYSLDSLRKILAHEALWDRGWSTPGGVEIHGRTTNPAEGGEWLAISTDVRGALMELRGKDQQLLEMKFRHGLLLSDIAHTLETTEESAERMINFALGRLRRHLGGGRPFMDNRYVGTRRVISNAQAIARTQGQD